MIVLSFRLHIAHQTDIPEREGSEREWERRKGRTQDEWCFKESNVPWKESSIEQKEQEEEAMDGEKGLRKRHTVGNCALYQWTTGSWGGQLISTGNHSHV